MASTLRRPTLLQPVEIVCTTDQERDGRLCEISIAEPYGFVNLQDGLPSEVLACCWARLWPRPNGVRFFGVDFGADDGNSYISLGSIGWLAHLERITKIVLHWENGKGRWRRRIRRRKRKGKNKDDGNNDDNDIQQHLRLGWKSMTSWLRSSWTVKKIQTSPFNSMISADQEGTPNRMQDPTHRSTNPRWWLQFLPQVKSDLMGEQTILCGMLQTGRGGHALGIDNYWNVSHIPNRNLGYHVACAEMLHVARCWHLNVKIWEGAVLSFDKMVANGIDPGYVSLLQAGAKGWWCQYHKLNALKQARSFTSTGQCDGMCTMSTGCAWGLQTDSVRMGNHHRGVTIQLLTVQTELVMVWVFLLFEDSNFGQFLSGKRPWSMVASPVWWIAWTILLRCRVAAGHKGVSCTPVMKGCDSWAAFALWHRFIVLLTIVNPKNFLGLTPGFDGFGLTYVLKIPTTRGTFTTHAPPRTKEVLRTCGGAEADHAASLCKGPSWSDGFGG